MKPMCHPGDWVRIREGSIGHVWAIAKDITANQYWYIVNVAGQQLAVVDTAIVEVRVKG